MTTLAPVQTPGKYQPGNLTHVPYLGRVGYNLEGAATYAGSVAALWAILMAESHKRACRSWSSKDVLVSDVTSNKDIPISTSCCFFTEVVRRYSASKVESAFPLPPRKSWEEHIPPQGP